MFNEMECDATRKFLPCGVVRLNLMLMLTLVLVLMLMLIQPHFYALLVALSFWQQGRRAALGRRVRHDEGPQPRGRARERRGMLRDVAQKARLS